MTQLRDVPVFGLLYISDFDEIYSNLADRGPNAIDVYLRCAILCGRSIARNGGRYAIITNDAKRLEARLNALDADDIAVRQHRFTWRIPREFPFHSCTYRLELLEAIGRGEYGPAAAVMDLDAVQVRPFDLPALPEMGLICYEIGKHHSANWPTRADMEVVAGHELRTARWWGASLWRGPRRASPAFPRSRAIAGPAMPRPRSGFTTMGTKWCWPLP